ncbi:extracellular solute-binding protein [Alteromonas sp. PRIM-21]|uniref:extracellular solute-binding protein n=1 Tax=Alteromonas sp. PRIM-21 TaxID=1454978 RepID=UPI0022B996CE|nr:extracellular solute-binding protein [Alteromonas sp. PRIM-21]MCZ8529419.1 extracellular solute-binding protein [Alteromonas sp. PRIM-21]
MPNLAGDVVYPLTRTSIPKKAIGLYLLCLVFLLGTNFTYARPIALATSEVSPFSDSQDVSKGYVNEIVVKAFEELGEPLNVERYPHARALMLAKTGALDGVFPVHDYERVNDSFLLSDAIPAGASGFLIRTKDFKGSSEIPNLVEWLKRQNLRGIGYLRGTVAPKFLSNEAFFNMYPGKSTVNLLDLLGRERIDVLFIDKYSAKEALVNERPSLIGEFIFIPGEEVQSSFHLALSKQNPKSSKLIEKFNLALQKQKQNGLLARTLEKYGVYNTSQNEDALIVGAPDINAVFNAKAYLDKYGSPLSQSNIQWRIMDETVLRRRLLGNFSVNENSFDLVLIGNYGLPIWAKRDILVPFNTHPDDYDINDVIPAALHANTVDGKLYGLPFVAETTLTFYRKDLLEKFNLSLPSVLTYTDVKALAQQVHMPEKEIYGVGLRTRVGWGQNMALVSTMANTYGASWLDEKMRPTLDSAAWLNAVKMYADLAKNVGPPGNEDMGWQENQKLFAQGKLAFFVDASSLGGALFDKNFSKVTEFTGVTYAPLGKQQKGAQWFWSWNFAVPKQSRYVKESQQLAHFLTSKTFIDDLKKVSGEYAAPSGTRHSTYSSAYQQAVPYAAFEHQALKLLSSDDLSNSMIGRQFIPIPEFTAIGYAVGAQINDVVTGKKSVKVALDNAQNQTEIILERAGYFTNKGN